MNKIVKYYAQKHRQDLMREKLKNTIGKKCRICASLEGINYHNVRNEKHSPSRYQILKNAKDFVPLCWKCHRAIHFLIRSYKTSGKLHIGVLDSLLVKYLEYEAFKVKQSLE